MMYRSLATNYFYTNKITRCLECYEIAIEELPKIEINKRVFFWCELADIYYREYMLDKAEKKYKNIDDLVNIYKDCLDNNTMFYYYYWKGIMLLRTKYRIAKEHFEKALDYATKKFEKAGAISNMGLASARLKRYKDALEYYEKALTYPDETNLSPMVVTYNNMADVYRNMKDYENAQKYLELALEANEKQYNLTYHLACIQTKLEIQVSLGNKVLYKEYHKILLSTKGKNVDKTSVVFRIKRYIENVSYNKACLKNLSNVLIELSEASDSDPLSAD